MSKNVMETHGPQMTSEYGACALHAGLIRVHARNAHAHPRIRVPTRTHAHACTHRPISNTYCFSTAMMIRECDLMIRYTYIACRVRKCYRNVSAFKPSKTKIACILYLKNQIVPRSKHTLCRLQKAVS